jgi:hypothetical protein
MRSPFAKSEVDALFRIKGTVEKLHFRKFSSIPGSTR